MRLAILATLLVGSFDPVIERSEGARVRIIYRMVDCDCWGEVIAPTYPAFIRASDAPFFLERTNFKQALAKSADFEVRQSPAK